MIRTRVTVDTRVLDDVQALAAEAPKAMTEARKRVRKVAVDYLDSELFSFEPGEPTYPLRWTSDKQRRAFFATNGFGRGIPAKRHSPPDVSQYEIIERGDRYGGVFTIVPKHDYMPFVIGWPGYEGWQQQFHIDTGWPTLAEVTETFDQASEIMSDLIIDEWYNVALGKLYGVLT